MAHFKQGNVIIKDNKGIVFGDESDASIIYNADTDTLEFNATSISGINSMSVHGNEWHSTAFATVSGLDTVSGSLHSEIVNISLTPGPEGPQGPQGIQGPQGETGASGVQGPIGPEGPGFENIEDYATWVGVDTISGSIIDELHEWTETNFADIGHEHEGFYQPVGSYATTTELLTASGILNDKIDTTSGTLQSQITNHAHDRIVEYDTSIEINDDNSFANEIIITTGGSTAGIFKLSGSTGVFNLHYGNTVNEFSSDGTFADNSSLAVPTERATKTYVDTVSGSLASQIAGVSDHASLTNLDYASSGHTGFQPAGDYATNSGVNTISGSIVDQIPTDYISDSEITTISGNIVSQIITDHGTLTGLSDNDHPQYDFSTASGILNSKIDTTSGTLQDAIDNIELTPGPEGPQGPQGIQGIQGETGASGVQGPQGVQGPAGVSGTNGLDGTNGIDGDSAYEVAVDDGFIGDVSAWLASLIGPQGPAGVSGTNGLDGADGAEGPQGPQGEVGPTGASGVQGPQGPQGIQGETGLGFDNIEDYATWSGVNTISGVLQGQIDEISPSMAFTDLTDVPTSYAGQAGLAVVVNGTADGLIFTTISGAQGPQGEPGVSGTNGVDGIDGEDGADGVAGRLNPYLDTDHSYSSSAVASGTAGEALVFGDVCYFKSDGKYWKSNATTNSGTMPVRAMALETISGSATGNFLVGQGYVRDDSWTWTTAGDIYASTTSGSITQTAVSGTGNVHQILGYATASGTIMFNPSSTYIVRA
jgi:hypothetical protein